MIYFTELTITEKPITSKEIEVKEVDNWGKPVLDEKGKQKTKIKKDNPKAKLNSVSHYAIQDTVTLLNKKYGLNLKTYDLFGGDSQNYIKKFLKKICNRVDFLNDRYDNTIDITFNTPIQYEGKTRYLNFDSDKLVKRWSKDILKIIEEELKSAVNNKAIGELKDLENYEYLCLSDDCLYKIHQYINNQLIYIFNDMKNAKLMINRNESFSAEQGLLSTQTITEEKPENYGLTI